MKLHWKCICHNVKGKHKHFSKTCSCFVIHAKYKTIVSNNSNLFQTAYTTSSIICFIQQFILFALLQLHCVCVPLYSLHEIFFHHDNKIKGSVENVENNRVNNLIISNENLK